MESRADEGEGNALDSWIQGVKNNNLYVKASDFQNSVSGKIEGAIEYTWERAEIGLNRIYATVLEMPKVTVALMIILAAWFGWIGTDFQNLIEDDVEIFLPDGADSTELLLEVREEWTTDLAIIYIQSSNAILHLSLIHI